VRDCLANHQRRMLRPGHRQVNESQRVGRISKGLLA
jgi:hypothetical protein